MLILVQSDTGTVCYTEVLDAAFLSDPPRLGWQKRTANFHNFVKFLSHCKTFLQQC